jgi:hypothetical protein
MSEPVDSVPAVGARQPCPCGSGRRYKACHGKAASRAVHSRVLRPFAGLADEPDWVAMREVVSAGTAELSLSGRGADRTVTLSTVLPLAWPALVRQDGSVMVAMQTQTSSADLSRDVGDALSRALDADPGTPIPPRPPAEDAPRLQELLDVSAPLHVVVHSSFDYWVEGADEVDAETRASLERAGAAIRPTARLAGVQAAYWVAVGDRVQLRWVLAEDEDPLTDALARLSAAGSLGVGDGSRYLGSFRALGLLVPVWDLAEGTQVEDVEDPALAFRARLDDALAVTEPLSGAERRARQALAARQLTLG